MIKNIQTPPITPPFSPTLQAKIDRLKEVRKKTQLGSVSFDSPLILAPMSGICTPPFRLLMEDLGAGGTVSELISATGTFYQNAQTLEMLNLDPREKNVGLQLFGENAEHMAFAAQIAESKGAKFIDINMGCPVRKVVTKGAGSALLREPADLIPYLKTIRQAIKIPLTIKIRIGWSSPNADEVLKIAQGEGVEFVAIHGRTREQQYRGHAHWDYLETLPSLVTIPLIGNGDLHTPFLVKERLKKTNFPALMIGRGCLRNPFIFLESYHSANSLSDDLYFTGEDYYAIIERFAHYLHQNYDVERKVLVQLKKVIVWFAAGFPHTVKFRASIFPAETISDVLKLSQDYFYSIKDFKKNLDLEDEFMNGGHG